jgi:hypothetical protein
MYDADPIATTLTNLADVILRRVVHRTCPVCDAENWTFSTEAAIAVQWAIPRTDGEFGMQSTGDTHLTIAFVCLDCGYMRWHMPTLEMRTESLSYAME